MVEKSVYTFFRDNERQRSNHVFFFSSRPAFRRFLETAPRSFLEGSAVTSREVRGGERKLFSRTAEGNRETLPKGYE